MNYKILLISLCAALLLSQNGAAQNTTLERSAETGSERETIARTKATRVFGRSLFALDSMNAQFTAFNPDYQIQRGDSIRLQIWGATTFNEILQVDAQGNLFIPEIGPVTIAGVRNENLNEVITAKISEVYISHINIYANLEAAQQVKVYVAGYVNRPGLYGGLASDNLINYIKLAGGIDLNRGSFIKVDIKRGGELRKSVNLYDFLTEGEVPLMQFADGDVIFIHPLQKTFAVEGLAKNPFQFEFSSKTLLGEELMRLAQPNPIATTAIVKRSMGKRATVVNLTIPEVRTFEFLPGDRVVFSADRQKETLLVKVEGEHDGEGYMVMPYGATVGDLYDTLEFSPFSNTSALQLFRKSVQERQKEAILSSLQRLENNVLSARSSTADEARLRAAEAELLMQFVDRARQVDPLGQVVLNGENWRDIRLEDSDRVVVPGLSNLVMVQGEVNFPNTQTFREDAKLKDYIELAGGFTENAEKDRIILLRANGEINLVKERLIRSYKYELNRGDEIIVLPEVDKKYFPLIRDLSQIIYNLAIATKVVLDV